MFILFLFGESIPIISLIIPLYILVNRLGLGGSRWSIIFPFVAMNLGITVLILRGFFRSIPTDIEDAAKLDGCNAVQLIFSVMIPIVRPGLVVAAALNFIAFWNEYFIVSILADSQQMMTVPAGLAAKLINYYSTNWPAMAAGIMLSLIPVFLLFTFAQEKIVQGWSSTTG
jgi:ABC-type glycerol-3-phosphate transport system permease component